jgi:exopolyphosphatase/guanosine-5'-triphosphate,3'-diphosphate pyrophosphatase
VAVGSGVLADAHLRGDPPHDDELRAVRERAVAAFAQLEEPPDVSAAFAVGGSANSLRRLAGPRLDEAVVAEALRVLCSAHSTEVAARMDLDARRVRLLPAGLLVLAAAAARLGRPLELALGGLREGVVIEMLQDVHGGSPTPQ